MVDYIEYLIKDGIYFFGNNVKIIAAYLVSNGCKVHMGKRRQKTLENYKRKGDMT